MNLLVLSLIIGEIIVIGVVGSWIDTPLYVLLVEIDGM
jgi:hypothetical protein